MHPGREAQSNLFDCRVPTYKFSMKSHCMPKKKKKKVNSLTWHTKPLRSDAYQFCQLVPIPSFPSHPRIRSKQKTCYTLNMPIFGIRRSLSSATGGTIALYWGYFLTCLPQNFHPPTSSITSDQTWLGRVLGPFGFI